MLLFEEGKKDAAGLLQKKEGVNILDVGLLEDEHIRTVQRYTSTWIRITHA